MGYPKHAWAGPLGTAICFIGLLTSAASAASWGQSSTTAPHVNVLIVNQVSVDDGTLRAARSEVVRMFAQINLDIAWREDVPAGDAPLLVVCITHEPAYAAPVDREALGAAASSPGVRGVRAYVFYPRVVNAVRRYAADVKTVLAMAIAHELGHLLRPNGEHDRDGLMRGEWSPREFALAAKGELEFSAMSAEEIRRGLRR